MFRIQAGQKFETAEDVGPHLEGLKDGITTVEFGGSSYGVGACKAIADRLATINTIEVANLDDMFTGRAGQEIPQSMVDLLEALVNKTKLHTINLSDNAFGIATIEPLEKFLAQHVPLEHLYFANNGFGPQAGARLGVALQKLAEAKKAAKSEAKLVTVVCGRNRLENGSMEAWAGFIRAHATIEELRLYQNGIRQEGIEVLMREGLAYAPHLKKLDLQDNTFTDRGSIAMSEVLGNWPEIVEIGVSDCLLSAKGAHTLAQKLHDDAASLANLEILRLQYNEMDERGLGLLFQAVEKNVPKLKLLELNGNKFSDAHAYVERLNLLFGERGFGELDELDDMEEDTEDEDDDDSEAEDENDIEAQLEEGARDAKFQEAGPGVSGQSDEEVDALAAQLAKQAI